MQPLTYRHLQPIPNEISLPPCEICLPNGIVKSNTAGIFTQMLENMKLQSFCKQESN